MPASEGRWGKAGRRYGLLVGVLCWGAALLPGARMAGAQGVTLRGFVTDRADGQPLHGANVVLRDIRRDAPRGVRQAVHGSVSDANGYYAFSRIPPGTYALAISFVGYETYADTLHLGADALVTRSVVLQPAAEALGEVVVASEGGAARLEAGRQRVRAADLSRIPTPDVSGDLATYLQTLPGVVSLGDRGGQLFIRGGTPSQNLVLLDGLLIYQPFHIIGFFSAFPEDLVATADVYAGGFDARYTGRLSSVIDVTMRSGNLQRFEGAVSASPFVTGLRLEGPLRTGRVSLLGSVRTSVVEWTAPVILGQDLPLSFGDVFVKLQKVGGDNSRCSVTAMRTYDRGRIDPERTDEVFRWSNTVVGGRCLVFTPGSSVLVETGGGFSYVGNAVGDAADPARAADAWRINTDLHLSFPLGAGELNWGFYGRADRLAYDLGEQFLGLAASTDFLIGAGAYIGAELVVSAHLSLHPSLALTIPLDFRPGLEPRFRMTWRPRGTDAQQLHVALGFYRQELEGVSDERDVGSVFTAWMPAPLGGARASAWHALLGWQQHLGPFDVSVEGYYKRLNSLPVPIWSTLARFTTALTPADGDVYGSDVRLEYRATPLYVYLGYGYARTVYAAAQENFGVWFGEPVQRYAPPHDRRHQLNAVVGLHLGAFEASVRWQYGSGLPFTQALGYDRFVDLTGMTDVRRSYGIPRFLFDRPYAARQPAYHRLDASLERVFRLPRAGLRLQAGVVNVYDRDNLFYFDLLTLRRVDQLPFLPYLSMQLEVH